MIVSVLKKHFRKLPPRVNSYRDLSNYNANFIESLNEKWSCLSLKRTFENFHQELLVTGIYLIIMQTL